MNAEKIARIAALSEQIKALEAECDALKKEVKDSMGEGSYAVGDFSVEIRSQIRESLDRAGLEKTYGIEAINKFAKLSEYKVVTIKRLKKVA